MAFQPGLAGSQFPGEDYILRELKDLRRAVQELSAADPFAPMGMKPSANAVTFGGSVTINGNLAVPNGSITNAALSNPSRFGQLSVNTTNFALTTTATSVASGTITVPDGYSQANVTVTVTVGAVNMTATGDFLYCQASINGVAANEIFSYASGNQGSAWTGSTKTATLTGLTGGVITLSALGRSQNAAWSANTSNRAFVEAVVTFLR